MLQNNIVSWLLEKLESFEAILTLLSCFATSRVHHNSMDEL